MTADLLIIVPTRRRRANVERFLDAASSTSQAVTDFLLVADDDDPSYAGLALPPRCRLATGPRAWLTQKLNRHAVPAALDYPAVGFLGDDAMPVTPGWDCVLLSYLSIPGIVYADSSRRNDIGEHEIVSSEIIRALGWYFEPSLNHYWTDMVLADLGRGAGCYRFVREAVIEHRHYDSGAEYDLTYSEAESNGERDAIAYQKWRAERFASDLEKVRAAIA